MTFALIDGESGAFGVVVPDLLGGASALGAVEEALRNGTEAAPLWRDDARADGEAIPEPRAIEDLRRDPGIAAAPCSASCQPASS
jgi:predicted RNase H-like HicB family nuclease